MPSDQNWNLNDYAECVLVEYRKHSKKDLKEILKINDNISDEVEIYRKNFTCPDSFPAIFMYNGLSFRTMKAEEIDEKGLAYLQENLYILSALYGPVHPLENIKGYRLDFTSKLKVDGKGLKRFWKENYSKFFKEKEKIINLASNEFSEILNKDDFQWLDFEFYESDKKKLKKHSTISKKARGLMVRYLADNIIEDVEAIKRFNYAGYKYNIEMSNDTKMVFIREK